MTGKPWIQHIFQQYCDDGVKLSEDRDKRIITPNTSSKAAEVYTSFEMRLGATFTNDIEGLHPTPSPRKKTFSLLNTKCSEVCSKEIHL